MKPYVVIRNKVFKSFIHIISKILPPFGGVLLYLMFFFTPRLFLLTLLIIDIFYYSNIELFILMHMWN